MMKRRIGSMCLALLMIVGLFFGGYQPAEAADEITADWYNFRNSDSNMAITSAKTPTSAKETMEKWSVAMGTGPNDYSSAPSVQIIVDHCLVVMSDTKIKKLSLQDGSLVAEGTMAAKSAFSYVSPTYADGTIYCALSGGIVQAFDAKTLESKWVYQDALGGQDQSPVTYHDGYVYTGFFNQYTTDANYVCVNAKTGEKVWTKANKGGYYWAGATVVGDAIIVGGADGEKDSSGKAPLYALNLLTGEVITGLYVDGDICSSMAYADGRVYFVTKSGYLCSAAVDSATGALSDLKQEQFSTTSATSTPVVYKGYVYFGADDKTFKVAKADTLKVVQSVSLKEASKSSWLLSTAYESSEGKLYFYGTCNVKPGGISMVKVDANDPTKCELEELFKPLDAAKQQYCICSVICDKDGNLYYKNDSQCVFALTSNKAYLEDLTSNVGIWTESFRTERQNLELVVPVGTERVSFTCKANVGSAVTLNGGAVTEPVALTGGTAKAVFKVSNGTEQRTYTVSIREAAIEASLGALKVSNNNSVTNTTYDRTMTPEFSSDTEYYGIYDVPEDRSSVNLWPQAADENASVKVYALSNVGEDKNHDAQTGEITKAGASNGRDRYMVKFADKAKPMAVKIVVTAEDGLTQKTYTLVISQAAAAEEAKTLLEELKPSVQPAAPAKVQVTISDQGKVVMAVRTVTVEDLNRDGKLSVDETLVAAHNLGYEGGAEAGYASADYGYGLAITKLWGDTSGAFGYWLNHTSCMSLDDTVTDGDSLVAFVYKDGTTWSDIYAGFEKFNYTAAGSAVEVGLIEVTGYDEFWKAVFGSMTGADIAVYDENMNRMDSGYQITELGDGKYAAAFAKAGTYILIGTKEDENTVPAVCRVLCEKGYEDPKDSTTGANKPSDQKDSVTGGTKTGDDTPIFLYAGLVAITAVAVGILEDRRRRTK